MQTAQREAQTSRTFRTVIARPRRQVVQSLGDPPRERVLGYKRTSGNSLPLGSTAELRWPVIHQITELLQRQPALRDTLAFQGRCTSDRCAHRGPVDEQSQSGRDEMETVEVIPAADQLTANGDRLPVERTEEALLTLHDLLRVRHPSSGRIPLREISAARMAMTC